MPDLENTIKRTLVHQSAETSVFLIGSARSPKRLMFHEALSDTDLLIVPKARSLDDYTCHIKEIMRLSKTLDPDNKGTFDIFFISKDLAPLFFTYLKAFGISTLSEREAVVGPKLSYSTVMSEPEVLVRQLFYQAETVRLASELQRTLPVANTSEARHVVKEISRCCKTLLCSLVPISKLEALEDELMTASDIFAVKNIASRMGVTIPVDDTMKAALDGQVDDWPGWMIAQEEMAKWFTQMESDIPLARSDKRRLCEHILEVRYMLFASLRNIFLEVNETRRLELISEYADRTASLLVVLGLAGISPLVDFSTDSTPMAVRQANDVLVRHLQSNKPTIECLAAAVVLLEFSFKSAVNANVFHRQGNMVQ